MTNKVFPENHFVSGIFSRGEGCFLQIIVKLLRLFPVFFLTSISVKQQNGICYLSIKKTGVYIPSRQLGSMLALINYATS